MKCFASCRRRIGLLPRASMCCCSRLSVIPLRACSTSATGQAGSRVDSQSASTYNQFRYQQQQYHRHSFFEKGSAAPQGSAEGHQQHQEPPRQSSSSSSSSSASGRAKEKPAGGRGSATAQQRRQSHQRWEMSFFGRVHFDEGMHSRFAKALASEEEEAYRQSMEGHTHAELFPHWPEDEEAPLAEFKRLRPSLQLRYIVNRLSMGERRIRYAVDYGSLSMMYQLNLGELMVKEAEKLLVELGWLNDDVAAQIEEVKAQAEKIKYDFDLD